MNAAMHASRPAANREPHPHRDEPETRRSVQSDPRTPRQGNPWLGTSTLSHRRHRRRGPEGGQPLWKRRRREVGPALGLDDSTLYDYAQVAGRWDKRAFESLLRRNGKYGLPLSWSHLAELALVIDDERREGLIQTTLQNGLSVRKLKEQIGSGPTEDPVPPDDGSEPSAPAEGRAHVPTSVANGLAEVDYPGEELGGACDAPADGSLRPAPQGGSRRIRRRVHSASQTGPGQHNDSLAMPARKAWTNSMPVWPGSLPNLPQGKNACGQEWEDDCLLKAP